MNGTFDFEPRSECVCGVSLDDTLSVVRKRYAWGEIRFQNCTSCRSWCQSPQVSAPSLAAWFASSDYFGTKDRPGAAYADYLADEANRVSEARHRVDRDLSRIFPPGSRLLEIGCATGSLLAALREKGYLVTGIDVSEPFAERARSIHGLEVHIGSFTNVPLPGAGFDGVLLFGTIGNLPNLVGVLRRIRELLSVGGLLVFNTPVADAWIVRHVYRSGFWMFTPSVNSFATETGLRRALERAGFEILTIRQDFQRPSLSKLLYHGKLDGVLPLMKRFGLGDAALPFPIPVPSVRFVVARRAGRCE